MSEKRIQNSSRQSQVISIELFDLTIETFSIANGVFNAPYIQRRFPLPFSILLFLDFISCLRTSSKFTE